MVQELALVSYVIDAIDQKYGPSSHTGHPYNHVSIHPYHRSEKRKNMEVVC